MEMDGVFDSTPMLVVCIHKEVFGRMKHAAETFKIHMMSMGVQHTILARSTKKKHDLSSDFFAGSMLYILRSNLILHLLES